MKVPGRWRSLDGLHKHGLLGRQVTRAIKGSFREGGEAGPWFSSAAVRGALGAEVLSSHEGKCQLLLKSSRPGVGGPNRCPAHIPGSQGPPTLPPQDVSPSLEIIHVLTYFI